MGLREGQKADIFEESRFGVVGSTVCRGSMLRAIKKLVKHKRFD
jgi:hypothetical protein